jgi:hypothetical protein
MYLGAAVFHLNPAARLHSTFSLLTTAALQIDAAAMALHVVVDSNAKWNSHISVRSGSPLQLF